MNKNNMAIGLPLGMLISLVIGKRMGNIGLGLVLSPLIGLIFGLILNVAKSKNNSNDDNLK